MVGVVVMMISAMNSRSSLTLALASRIARHHSRHKRPRGSARLDPAPPEGTNGQGGIPAPPVQSYPGEVGRRGREPAEPPDPVPDRARPREGVPGQPDPLPPGSLRHRPGRGGPGAPGPLRLPRAM